MCVAKQASYVCVCYCAYTHDRTNRVIRASFSEMWFAVAYNIQKVHIYIFYALDVPGRKFVVQQTLGGGEEREGKSCGNRRAREGSVGGCVQCLWRTSRPPSPFGPGPRVVDIIIYYYTRENCHLLNSAEKKEF